MTRRPRVYLFALALIIAAVLALLAWAFYPTEPSHQGKRLSKWVVEYATNYWRNNPGPAAKAQAAVRHIGADGVPFLLDAIATEPSSLKKKLRDIFPPKWHRKLRIEDKSGDTRRMGSHGIAALGTNAPPDIIPRLMMIITNHPHQDSRYIAAYALRTLGPAAEPAIPFFVECLKKSDHPGIRDEAAIALGLVQCQPEVTVPALTNYLEFCIASFGSSKFETSEAWDAIRSLRNIGPKARAALPLLRSLLNHKDSIIRDEAEIAVRHIDDSYLLRPPLRPPD
jgi:hypothetical protein